MKILGISMLMFILLVSISMGIDYLLGFRVSVNLVALNPFYVMETPEIVIFFLMIFFLVVRPLVSFSRKRNKRKKGSF
ncbi:hypothetical protein [Shouchella patagoniensis]|uniref:hypothetical protein n=1 Tax=Shouchella patagoniensis TaxID=228576 RepID=UPI0009950619|nr:hypothetical protein [Shouchella patagoniensis]